MPGTSVRLLRIPDLRDFCRYAVNGAVCTVAGTGTPRRGAGYAGRRTAYAHPAIWPTRSAASVRAIPATVRNSRRAEVPRRQHIGGRVEGRGWPLRSPGCRTQHAGCASRPGRPPGSRSAEPSTTGGSAPQAAEAADMGRSSRGQNFSSPYGGTSARTSVRSATTSEKRTSAAATAAACAPGSRVVHVHRHGHASAASMS